MLHFMVPQQSVDALHSIPCGTQAAQVPPMQAWPSQHGLLLPSGI
jgi:hypothetical protein